jgi:hypothetical protein
MGNPTFDELYSDLTLANVSHWEVAYSSNNTLVPDSGLTHFIPSSTFFRLRQVLHYVHPGDIRVQTVSNDSLLHVLAFKRNNSGVVIIENTGANAQNVFLSGIPSGTYGLSKSNPGASFFQELGVRTVTNDTITIPAAGGSVVTTLYPYSLPNHAPTIITFRTVPGYLADTASTATLISSANDAELDPHTFQWSAVSFPGGANPVIANPAKASSAVSGLTAAGTYIFRIDVSDGINTSSKKVYLIKYTNTPPPVLNNSGFRIASPYGLVFAPPGDTTHANIELPLTSVILQANVGSITGTGFVGQGNWSLVSQPGGANAKVDSTIYIYVSLRANATNMTVPGDYVFQINVTNPGHPDLIQQVICTVHPASSPPVIHSIVPSPAVITLPQSSMLLTAVTSDPDLDLLRHWWAIVSVPTGAIPQFDNQCKPVTNISGLTIPGIYTFQLRTFDDLHMVTQNISIKVNTATSIETITGFDNDVSIFPNPFNDELTFTTSSNQLQQIILYDMMSRELQRQQFTNSVSLNTEQLAEGIYIYELKSKDGKIKAGKIIRQ